jgi:alkanesulfonate monooxygenase SsuD/methylene tetrahydromethanopterin reductase-like flavin-dependent oxidoreductase (luciferase family)
MDLGLALPQYDYPGTGSIPLPWSTVAGYATTAERLRFRSLWLSDHISMTVERHGGPPGEHRGFEPLVTLGGLTRITTSATLGTLVLCSQLRPVTVLAKMLAGVDHMSGGRLVAGMGAGWHEADYTAAGVPFERPGRRLQQLSAAIEAVRIVWRGDPGAPPCLPAPVQAGGPPVWVGGRGDRMLELVARHADGWHLGWTLTRAAYRQRVDVLERACERVGRDPASITRAIGLFTLVGEDEADLRKRFERLRGQVPPGVLDRFTLDEWKSGRLVGTVEQVSEQMAGWADAGVAHLISALGAVPFQSTTTDDLDLVASAASSGVS